MAVPILKQGDYLIATIQSAMTDSEAVRLRDDLMRQIGVYRSRGIIVDITSLDVMDSFAARSLRTIAHMTLLRGADTVVVGMQPEVAFAMVQLGLGFEDVHTALDLEEGLAFLDLRRGGVTMPLGRIRIVVSTDGDIVVARQAGRDLAKQVGCSATDATLVATAISEVARNIVSHAGKGEVLIRAVPVGADAQGAIEVVARDEGPGIVDVERAMQDGYSTGRGLGLGLPGARRLMDEFEIVSEVGVGTTVVMRKWCTP